MKSVATANAPATTGNAAVGFDVLGFVVGVLHDTVTVRRAEPGVVIADISNPRLPRAAERNTAGVALYAMIEALGLDFGFSVQIEKGIPLGSGLGGSAASAVGAVVAANALLDEPATMAQLFEFALAGEAISSGHAHPDNVAPCLYGGLTLTTERGVQVLPTPSGLELVIVHPNTSIRTRDARAVLPTELPLALAVQQMGHLAAFVDACHRGDAESFAYHCRDLIVEPHRKSLLPGFDDAAAAARDAGALAFSLSGSGPTVFALTTEGGAQVVADKICAAFKTHQLETTSWTSKFGGSGAEVTWSS